MQLGLRVAACVSVTVVARPLRPPDALRRRSYTQRTCLAVGPTQFTPPHQTRQNRRVCVSCLAWRCELGITVTIPQSCVLTVLCSEYTDSDTARTRQKPVKPVVTYSPLRSSVTDNRHADDDSQLAYGFNYAGLTSTASTHGVVPLDCVTKGRFRGGACVVGVA